MVEVTLVKTPVDGVVPPMEVPLIVPPEMVAFGVVRLPTVAALAKRDVPVAVVKPMREPKNPVEVAFAKVALVA